MDWKRLFNRGRSSEPSKPSAITPNTVRGSKAEQTNWPTSTNGDIVALWHNPMGVKLDDDQNIQSADIRAATITRAIGERDLMEEPLLDELTEIHLIINGHKLCVWAAVESSENGVLKHLMMEFTNEQRNEMLSTTMRLGLIIEPHAPAFFGISQIGNNHLAHLFWPVNWEDTPKLMPLGPGPYWNPPFSITRNSDNYKLEYEESFLEKLGAVSKEALDTHFGSIGTLLLTLQYLDLQRNWDMALLQDTELWPAVWPEFFRRYLAQFANHRLWACRVCGKTHSPEVPMTSDLVECVIDSSRHTDLPMPFTKGIMSQSVAAWPITASVMFCQIVYSCPACSSIFKRSEYIDTRLFEGSLPEFEDTMVSFHQCPGLRLDSSQAFRQQGQETDEFATASTQTDTEISADASPLWGLMQKLADNAEVINVLDRSVKKYGPEPSAAIISDVLANPGNDELRQMSAFMLARIGGAAISKLIPLLGHRDPSVAKFAAITLAAIDGSLQHVIVALKTGDERTRVNAAGSLQDFGPRAKPALDTMLSVLRSEDSEKVADILCGAIGKVGEAAATGLWELCRDTSNTSIRIRGVAGLWRVGKPALKFLYEMRQTETDSEVSKMVEHVINDLIGEAAEVGEANDELMLPKGAAVLVDLVNGISMRPVEITKSALKQMHELAPAELKPSLTRLQSQAEVTPQKITGCILEISETVGHAFLSGLLDNNDGLLRRIAGDCLSVAGNKALPFLIPNLAARRLDQKEDAAGALLRLIVTTPVEDFQDAIPALQDMIANGSLEDWTATVLAAAALAEAGEVAAPAIQALIRHNRALARLGAVAALRRKGGMGSMSILREVRDKEMNPTVREAIDHTILELTLSATGQN